MKERQQLYLVLGVGFALLIFSVFTVYSPKYDYVTSKIVSSVSVKNPTIASFLQEIHTYTSNTTFIGVKGSDRRYYLVTDPALQQSFSTKALRVVAGSKPILFNVTAELFYFDNSTLSTGYGHVIIGFTLSNGTAYVVATAGFSGGSFYLNPSYGVIYSGTSWIYILSNNILNAYYTPSNPSSLYGVLFEPNGVVLDPVTGNPLILPRPSGS